jgi:hypothetical protein
MTQAENTRVSWLLEEAITILFCEIDDTYRHLNPNGRLYESLKRLSDPEVITLALFQQLRGVESCRAFFLREAARFFSHLFPGVVELVGEPETLLIENSTLLSVMHPREVTQGPRASRARPG